MFINGYASFTVAAFKSFRSVTHLVLPSFFLTGTNGEAHGLLASSMTPCSINSSFFSDLGSTVSLWISLELFLVLDISLTLPDLFSCNDCTLRQSQKIV